MAGNGVVCRPQGPTVFDLIFKTGLTQVHTSTDSKISGLEYPQMAGSFFFRLSLNPLRLPSNDTTEPLEAISLP